MLWRSTRLSRGSVDRDFDEIAPQEIANAILACDLGYGRITKNIRSIIDRVVAMALPNDRFTADFLG